MNQQVVRITFAALMLVVAFVAGQINKLGEEGWDGLG
jgi:hypothetical protein